jgi:hypothetical protein
MDSPAEEEDRVPGQKLGSKLLIHPPTNQIMMFTKVKDVVKNDHWEPRMKEILVMLFL